MPLLTPARRTGPGGESGPAPGGADRSARAGLAAAVLVAVQAVGLVAAGLFLIIRALFPDAGHRGSTEVLGFLSLLVGVGVALTARGIVRRRRQPALIVLEIICLPVAVTIVQGGRWYIGVPLALVALGVLTLLAVAGLLLPERPEEE
jgi:hypothetical protein